MIAGYGSKPVFQYKFRPLMQDRRVMDGGFCVILYENRILSFSTYDVNGRFLDALCFSLVVDACVIAPAVGCEDEGCDEVKFTIGGCAR